MEKHRRSDSVSSPESDPVTNSLSSIKLETNPQACRPCSLQNPLSTRPALSRGKKGSSMAPSSFSLLLAIGLSFSLLPLSLSQCSSKINRLYSTCNDLPHLSASLHYTFDPNSSTIDLAFSAPTEGPDGWVAWALNPTGTGMAGSQALIAFRQPDGKMGVKTYNITGYGPLQEGPIAYRVSGLEAEHSGGVMRIYGKVVVGKGVMIVNEVWQVGATVIDGVPGKHAFRPENLAATGSLDLIKGQISGASGSDSALKNKNIHGVLNAVSWGLLLPIGAVIARYLKTFKSADPTWFYLHVSCQLIGYGVGVGGWATGLNLGSKSEGIVYATHRNIGITLFSLGTLQLFALLLRPNKDHKYRVYWNAYHYSVGYTVIILGIVNVFKGLQILSPENKWKEAYIIVIAALGGFAVLLEAVTWVIVLKRKSEESSKLHDGSNGVNGRGVQQPLSV